MNRSYLALFPSTWPPCRVCRGRGRDAEGRGGKPEERETSVLVVGPSLGEEHPPGFAPLVHAEGEQEVERGAGGGAHPHTDTGFFLLAHTNYTQRTKEDGVCVCWDGGGGGDPPTAAGAGRALPLPTCSCRSPP